jgi:hypothetical protein
LSSLLLSSLDRQLPYLASLQHPNTPDMPPDTASPSGGPKKDASHKERIGNYVMGAEIGRGSFASVYKGYRSVSHLWL